MMLKCEEQRNNDAKEQTRTRRTSYTSYGSAIARACGGGGGLRMEGRARMNLVIGHAAASFSEHRHSSARSLWGDGIENDDESSPTSPVSPCRICFVLPQMSYRRCLCTLSASEHNKLPCMHTTRIPLFSPFSNGAIGS